MCACVIEKTIFRVSSERAIFPPRGWNSYDSFSWTISEQEFLQSAEIISKNLLHHGYEVHILSIGYFSLKIIQYEAHLCVIFCNAVCGGGLPLV